MAGAKGRSGRKANEQVIRQNLLIILDQVDPSTERKRMLNILHKLVEAAEDGKQDAINCILDRVDGKPAQTNLGGGANGEFEFTIITGVPRADD